MKKVLLLFLVTAFIFGGKNYSKAQALEKGDVLITGFSSYPNWGKFAIETALRASDVNSYEVTGFPPSGLKLEFMLSNEIGFTLDGIFNSWNAKWSDNGFNNNDYDYEAGVFRTRIQIGMNYHIPDIDSDKIDLYGGFGIGSNSASLKFNTEDPNTEESEYIENTFLSFPLSARARIGGTYYVAENIGINAELATGGPLIGMGIVVKI